MRGWTGHRGREQGTATVAAAAPGAGLRAPADRGRVAPDGRATPTTGCPTRRAGCSAATPAPAGSTRFYPCRNAAESSRVYTVDPRDHLRADRDAEDRGLEIIGVMHSHTHTEAYPSPTDVAQAPDPALALRDRVAPRRGAGAAVVPHRRRRRSPRSGGRWTGGRIVDLTGRTFGRTRPTEPDARHGRLRLRPRPHRQHADGRRQPAQPQPRRCASSAKLEGQNPAGSVKDRIARKMIARGRGRRHAAPRARRSSSRRRATPASPWR